MRVGIDIGGTKIHAVAVAGDDRVIREVRSPTGYGPAAVLASTAAAVRTLARELDVAPADFGSIGVGIPGRVDSARGFVSHAVNLGVEALDLGSALERELGTVVRVENDVNAAALGAFRALGDPGIHSMAYLNLGTGLAAGLVVGGRLWRGSRGTAGEIGHIPVDPTGERCPCGQRGCLELAASGSAVARRFPTDHPRPVLALFDAADAGDPAAGDVRAAFTDGVAAAVRMLVLTVDVDTVVIGGGVSALGDRLIEPVLRVLRGWATDSPFLASLRLDHRVRLVPVGFPAAAVGAAIVGVLDPDDAPPASVRARSST